MRTFKRVLALMLAVLMVIPSFATVFAETVSVEDVVLNRASSYLAVGDTITLTATVLPVNATDASVTWSTSDDTVATVDGGVVTALAEGEATITATTTDGGMTATSKVVVSEFSIRNHVTVANPETDLRSLFDADSFEVYLPFEDNLTDKTGKTTATVTNSLAYADGYYGKAAQFTADGNLKSPYIDIAEAELGTEPTTIAFWFKKDVSDATVQQRLMSTDSGTNGFYIFATDYPSTSSSTDLFSINVNGTSYHSRVTGKLPADIYDGWSHIAYVKSDSSLKHYVDFELVSTVSSSTFKDKSLAGDLGLRLGNDADGTYYDYQGLMDDFFVYNGAMTADDLTELGKYYGVGVETVNVEGISLDKSSMCVAIGDETVLNATLVPAGSTMRAIEWTSSDETVATVSGGTVTALAEGETTITATTVDGGFTAECKITVLKMDIRNHVTESNPETDFRSLFDADSFEVYLPFEDNLTDKTGNTTATATGALKYADGYYGKAAQFTPNASYVSPYIDIAGTELTANPTTIAFWFKKDAATATEQPTLMKTYSDTSGFRIRATDYTNGTTDIFSMHISGSDFHTWAGTSSTSFPADMYDGWSHIAYVKGEASLKLYVDFELVKTFSNTNLKNMSLAGDIALRLGNDEDGVYYDYRGLLDDFFVYNGAMTADELTELGKYYGIGLPTVNLEGIELDKTEVYAVSGDTVQLNASFTPANATFKTIEWTSSDETVATVENGVVTTLSAGETTITATAADGGYTAKCDVYVSDTVSPRAHTMVEAPAATGGVEFTNLFDADKFRVYLPFENNVINEGSGDCTPVVKDDDYYGMRYDNGYYGRAARFDDGYIELNTDIDMESVTIGTWIKADDINTSVFLSNYGKEAKYGFDIKVVDSVTETANNSNATLYARNGEGGKEMWVTARQDKGKIPADAFDGWMHLTYTIDRKANQIIFYVDFKPMYSLAISADFSLKNDVYDLVLGRPADASVDTRLFGVMDDFFIYDDVLSAEDMLTLRDYYGLGGQTPVKSIALNKNTVNLDINGAEQLTATILPANAVNRGIEWTTSAPEIATVRDGKITANATGTATITATTADGNYTATCTVNVSENTTRYIYDQVVIFGIDGAGAFFKDTATPNIDRIFGGYATTYDGFSSNPSISWQNWTTILTGCLPEYHKRNNSNNLYFAYPEDSPYPSIFRLAREYFPTADLASYCEGNGLSIAAIERNVGIHWNNGDPEEMTGKALDYLNGKEDGRPPKIMFFYTSEPDHQGHAGGYGPEFPEYLEAITASDSYIGPIYDWYVENGYADNTLFIVCTDHGGSAVATGGGHGQLSEAEMYVFGGVSGRTVMKDSEITNWENRDVAAITAYALGMDIPETWSARVPDGVFADVNGMERNEVPYISSPIRNHVTEETPALDGGEHLTDVFDAEKFNILAEFDGNINDTTGNHETTQTGTITYEDGYFGQGANFSEGGYITTEDCHIATESFTIGFWLKYDMSDYTEDFKKTAVICSTYDLQKYAATPGFAIHTKEEHNLGFRQARTGMFVSTGATNPTVWKQLENWHFPDYDNKWVHYMFTFDRTTNKLTQYVDFKFHYTEPVSIKDSDLSNVSLIIGQNTTLDYTALKGSLDDFFIYKEAMTTDDIAKLAAYYGADKEAYVESITLSQNTAELNTGDKLTLSATVLPEDAMVKNVVWTSSNESVATVENGVVTARKGGNAVITATTVDGGFTAKCEITVISNGEEEPEAYLEGSSLVLDGRIGVKVYMSIDDTAVERAEFKVTTVNSDYVCTENSPNYSTLYRAESILTPVKDEATGKYYSLLYVAAKDIDNVSFETELVVYLKGDSETAVLAENANFDVKSYIEAAKKLAAEGEAAFVEALPLVESLETYGKYAENYFNGGALDSYKSSADSITFIAPRTNGDALVGAKLHATSLILEDNVTIRHYFDVTDIDAFNAAYTCDIEYGTKGGYIYYDIEDINAQSIGVPQTLTIKYLDGSVAYTVEYNVGNYIANMLNSSDSRLVSLVNAMYDYYIEAYTYNGSKELVSDNGETAADSWAN